MAERMLRLFTANPPSGGLLPRDAAQRPRLPGFEVGNLLFLAATIILGVATAGSLFMAGFGLLMHREPSVRPAAPNALPAPASLSHALPRARADSPTLIVRTMPVRPPAAPPRITPASPEPRRPPLAATVAMAQGDTHFAAGEVSVARFYFELAADAGDAEAAVRMGETFDPTYLTLDRQRGARTDPEAARFWYRRAVILGAAEAKQRLDDLETGAVAGATANPRSAAAQRLDRPDFHQLLERILHPYPGD
jgi:hypothetical protein